MDTAAERFGERRVTERQVADLLDAGRGHPDVLGERAVEDVVTSAADRRRVLAEVGLASLAVRTGATRHRGIHRDAVAGLQSSDVVTEFGDGSGALVSEHDGEVDGERAVVHVKVGRADAARTDSHHHLVRSRFGLFSLLYLHLTDVG